MEYQGLFYLAAGTLLYVTILLVLRVLGERKEGHKSIDINIWKTREKLKIVKIIDESHNVKTFLFKRDNGKAFQKFRPGQFLSFQIGDDEKLLRSYSISGSCENTSTLQVSIKLLKDGVGSSWFHGLTVGDKVTAYPPNGLFSDDQLQEKTPRIYVAGGIGITPLISMIKTSFDRGFDSPMMLFYGMNSTRDLVFHKELESLSERHKNFHYYPILSPGAENWKGDIGYITLDFIKEKTDLSREAHFYFCGPSIMTDGIIDSLKASKHLEDQIHLEKFLSPVSLNTDDLEKRQLKVELNSDSLNYDSTDFLLDFLEQNNVDMDFACRSGVCGACKCKLLSGDVESETDSGLTSSELKEGYILTCVSRPKSDVKLDL